MQILARPSRSFGQEFLGEDNIRHQIILQGAFYTGKTASIITVILVPLPPVGRVAWNASAYALAGVNINEPNDVDQGNTPLRM